MSKQLIDKNRIAQTIVNGQKVVFKINKGQHLRLENMAQSQVQDASGVVVIKHGNSLHLKFADDTRIQFDDFYTECTGNACSVTVAGKNTDGYTLSGSSTAGVDLGDAGQLVYAHGDHDTLMAMTSDNRAMASVLGSLDDGTVSYIPKSGMNLSLGMIAAGAAAVAAIGLPSTNHTSVATTNNNLVTGSVVAGPVVQGNDLKVHIYAANGSTLLGETTVDDTGHFSIHIGNYSGPIIAVLSNNGDRHDYFDEALGSSKNLNGAFMAVANVTIGTVNVNINVLTTVAALKSGVNSDGTLNASGSTLTNAAVSIANTAVASAFGLNNLLEETVVTTVTSTGTANNLFNSADGMSNAEKYGAVLASLSGADKNNGGDSLRTAEQLASGLEINGTTGTLNTAAYSILINGAQTTDPGNSQKLVTLISDATSTGTLSIDTIASDNIVNAAEVNATVTVTGKAAANAIVTLALGNVTHTVTADNNGQWSYDLLASDIANLGQGGIALRAQTDTGIASRGIFIDTIAPGTPAKPNAFQDNVGLVTSDTSSATYTDDTTPGIVIGPHLTDIPTLYVDGKLSPSTYNPATGTLTPDTPLGEGTHTFSYSLTDVTGNQSQTSASTTITVDTTAPTQRISSLSLSQDSGSSSTDWITRISNQSISGTLDAPLSPAENLYASLDGGITWQDISSSLNGSALHWAGATLQEGSGTLLFKIVDGAGNSGPVTTHTYTLDTTAPAAPTAAPDLPGAYDDGTSNTDNITSITQPGLLIGALPAGILDVELLVDGRMMPATYDSVNHTLMPTSPLADGTHKISYRYLDAAGNHSNASPELAVTLDTTAPQGSAITTVSASSILGSYEPGCTLALTIAGEPATGTLTTLPDGTWRYVPSADELVYLRSHAASELQLTVTDTAGNTAHASITASSDDFNAPYIREFIPADSGTIANGPTGTATLNLVFSKPVQAGTGFINLCEVGTTTPIAQISVSSSAVSIVDGSDVYITLPGLISGKHYYVTLDAGSFVDLQNIAYAGSTQANDSGWDFTATAASIAPDFVARDDIINISESANAVTIGGHIVSSSAILLAIESANITVTLVAPNGAPAVVAPLTSYNNATGEFSFTVPASAWREGFYSYTVSLAGTTGVASGVTASYTFADLAVDLSAPVITATLAHAQDDAGNHTGDLWANGAVSATTDDTSPYLSGTLSAPLSGDARVVVYRSDTTNPLISATPVAITGHSGLLPTGTTWSVSDSGLQDGHSYTYTAYVEDAAGNRSQASASATITVDTTAPTQRISGLSLSQDSGSSSTDWITRISNQSLSGTLDAPLTPGEALYASLDGGITWQDISSSLNGSALHWAGATLQEGSGTLLFKVVDGAGNSGPVTTHTYTLDTTAPAAPTAAPDLPGAYDDGTSNTDNITSITQPGLLIGTLPAGVLDVELLVDGRLVPATYDSANGTLRPNTPLVPGAHTIGYRWVDSAGNASLDSPTLSLTVIAAAAPSAPTDLSAIAAGSGGFVINGQSSNDRSGYSVASAGDVNGDGLDDLIIGAYTANNSTGRSYVVFGKTNTSAIDLSAVAAGSGGFAIRSKADGEYSGYSVASAGDVNGDGLADLIVGAQGSSPAAGSSAGRSYVVFGKTSTSAIDLFAIGTGGFVINGQSGSDRSGFSVASAGDVNGDGLVDLIVGAPASAPAGRSSAGRSYVVFGKTGNSAIDLSAVAAGTGGFVVNGQCSSDKTGFSVASAGDVNGDGLADVIVAGSCSDQSTGRDAGYSYVVFGKTGTSAIDLSAVAAGTGGFVINGEARFDFSGNTVASAGDVNGDGLADLIVGAYGNDPAAGLNAGRSYVVFGKTGTSAIDLSAVAAGTGGFVINGQCAGETSGYSVASAGDVNGDGLADLIVGATYSDPAAGIDAGRSYVVFGKTGTSAIDLSAVAAGTDGFVINGQCAGDWSGYSVASAGDVNGDGLADLIVGAYKSNGVAGRSYVIFGSTEGSFVQTAVDQMGSTGDDNLIASAPGQTLVSNAGKDTLTAHGASVLLGGLGNDTFVIDADMITALQTSGLSSGVYARVDGGSGVDTLQLAGSGLVLDLTRVANPAASNPSGASRLNSLEVIDLTGSGHNTLKLTAGDVLDMGSANLFETTGRQQLLIKGNSGDTLDLADGTDTTGWTKSGTQAVIDSVAYDVWNHVSLATIYVAHDLLVI